MIVVLNHTHSYLTQEDQSSESQETFNRVKHQIFQL